MRGDALFHSHIKSIQKRADSLCHFPLSSMHSSPIDGRSAVRICRIMDMVSHLYSNSVTNDRNLNSITHQKHLFLVRNILFSLSIEYTRIKGYLHALESFQEREREGCQSLAKKHTLSHNNWMSNGQSHCMHDYKSIFIVTTERVRVSLNVHSITQRERARERGSASLVSTNTIDMQLLHPWSIYRWSHWNTLSTADRIHWYCALAHALLPYPTVSEWSSLCFSQCVWCPCRCLAL